MNSNQKFRLFWSIIKHINERLCQNKLEISRIVLFHKYREQKHFRMMVNGFYDLRNKRIALKIDKPLISQIDTLLHELAHAYQIQILGHSGRHDKIGGELYRKFLKETDSILKISLKKEAK